MPLPSTRLDPALKAAYLIAMTGYGQEEDRKYAKEVAFDPHLTKPVDPNGWSLAEVAGRNGAPERMPNVLIAERGAYVPRDYC